MVSGRQVGRPTHGGTGTRLHHIWKGIKGRCQGQASAFNFYGARGVWMSGEWASFERFRDWALERGYDDERHIDRINSDGPYSPENCRWVLPIVNYARKELPRDGAYLAELDGNLDDQLVGSATPSARAYKLHDGNGLYLRVGPRGLRVWRMKFCLGGRERLLTFGRYPALSLSDARELREVARMRIRRGLDPCQVKAESRRRAERRCRAKSDKRLLNVGYG